MLRIFAGTLLSSTLLSGALASSFLTVPPMATETGPSFRVIDVIGEPALPVDATITASYGDADEPQVISAPRYVTVSPSISAMTPSLQDAPATTSIAAAGEQTIEADETPPAPRQQARQLEPMVIRGGLVGLAFPGAAPASQPDATERAPGSPTASSPPAAPSSPAQRRSSDGPPSTERGSASQAAPTPPQPPAVQPRPTTAIPL